MTFDDSISSTVPLSKILDCFIEEEEKPSTIIWFLKDHIDCIEDILSYSEHSDRMFFPDFVSRMSHQEMVEFYELMKRRAGRQMFFSEQDVTQLELVWRVLQCNLPETVKNIFREYLKNNRHLEYHPYRGTSRSSITRIFDNLFRDADLSIEEIAGQINSVKDDCFKEICENKEESLFYWRMLQKDLFVLLDLKKQFILLNELKNGWAGYEHFKFFKQILNSSVDVEIKSFIYHIFDRTDFLEDGNFLLTKEMKSLVEESVSYPQLMLKLDLWGIDDFGRELVFYLFCKHKLDWLVDIMESNEELLEEHFDIRDLINMLKEEYGQD